MNKKFSRLTQYTDSSLRILLQTLPDLIWLKDKDGIYLACNQRFEKILANWKTTLLAGLITTSSTRSWPTPSGSMTKLPWRRELQVSMRSG